MRLNQQINECELIKMEPMFTFIVPVYNVEQYIKRCINSLIEQSFSDFEILLIDDGSTDNSSQICDNYKAIDQRIRVIHKKNGGLSDARNVGIKESKGEYIFLWIQMTILLAIHVKKSIIF